MAKLGEDWVFIGLGLGAVYLVYKATKPVTDILNTASGITTSALTDLNTGIRSTGSTLLDKVQGKEVLDTPMDYLAASVPSLINDLVPRIFKLFTPAPATPGKNIMPSNIVPAKTQMLTNIAASQGLVSVAVPQMSVAPGAQVSPFTGQLFTPVSSSSSSSSSAKKVVNPAPVVVNTAKADLFKKQWEADRAKGAIRS